jgi:hypothetical protein
MGKAREMKIAPIRRLRRKGRNLLCRRQLKLERLEHRLLLAFSVVSTEFVAAPPTTLVAMGSQWSYLDDGTDQGTAWTEMNFDDSGWSSGLAELGYGDGDEATEIDFGGDIDAKITTTYFRHSFSVVDPTKFAVLELG